MNRKAGYTLFEVLVAFAIMAMVLAVLVPRQTLLLQRSSGALDRAMAQELALSELAQLGVVETLNAGIDITDYGHWKIHSQVTERTPLGERQAFDVTVKILDASEDELAVVSVIKVAK